MKYLLGMLLLSALAGCSRQDPLVAMALQDSQENPAQTGTRRLSDAPRVVVVGAGLSGLSTALELANGGAEVTVIDMSSVYGGHAVMSQGGISIIGTPLQEAQGQADSPDLAYEDFIDWGEGAQEQWVRYYVDHSRAMIYDWLTDLGVRFSGVEPAPGNRADRFHQPVGRGIGLVTPVYRACLEHAAVRFLWNTRADGLIVRQERVVGVSITGVRDGVQGEFMADAVVLATGGFQNNLDMVREFWPAEFKFPERILAGSGRHSIGLGHRMAQRAGAELVKMDYQWNYYSGLPDPQNPSGNKGLNA
ncbi:MAG: FAD-dependent oxidoreductase, partial [Pirellulaceae bacterium]|nr:FAD-dependent oxidoreductase [Pirellulaceae bacterium]